MFAAEGAAANTSKSEWGFGRGSGQLKTSKKLSYAPRSEQPEKFPDQEDGKNDNEKVVRHGGSDVPKGMVRLRGVGTP